MDKGRKMGMKKGMAKCDKSDNGDKGDDKGDRW